MHNVSRTNFVEQKASEDGNGKRRLQTYQNRKLVLAYSIKLEDGCKGTQTANKTVLVVSLIYKVRAHTTYKKTAANMIFQAAKVQRCGKHIKAHNTHDLTYHFAKWRLQFL